MREQNKDRASDQCQLALIRLSAAADTSTSGLLQRSSRKLLVRARDSTLDKTRFCFDFTRHSDTLLPPRTEYALAGDAKLSEAVSNDLPSDRTAIDVYAGADFTNGHSRARSKYSYFRRAPISEPQILGLSRSTTRKISIRSKGLRRVGNGRASIYRWATTENAFVLVVGISRVRSRRHNNIHSKNQERKNRFHGHSRTFF
jgi:hypothetical protein